MKRNIIFFLIAVCLLAGGNVLAALHNVWGWAWSENIGWISMNATNNVDGYTLIDENFHDDGNTYIYTNDTSASGVSSYYNIEDPSGSYTTTTTITAVRVTAYYQNPGVVELGVVYGAAMPAKWGK